MPLFTESTPLEANREELKDRVRRVAQLADALAGAMHHTNVWLWGLPESELLELLNDNVPLTGALFVSNENLGGAVNNHLDLYDDPRFRNRVPTERGRTDIYLDPVTGRFVIMPSDPEPEPEIVPEP